MYYQNEINQYLSTINTDIASVGRSLHNSIRQGSINVNDRENLELLHIGRDLLSNQIAIANKPTFFYKFRILDPTKIISITIDMDGSTVLESIIVNAGGATWTKQQAAEDLYRQLQDVSYDFFPITTLDFKSFLVNDSVYVYSSNDGFTSAAEVTINDTDYLATTNYLDSTADLIDSLNNGGSIDSLIPNIVDICGEFKDRKDYTKTNKSPYTLKDVEILTNSFASSSSSTSTASTSSHTQNTDSYLAKGMGTEVSASEIRTHIDNGDIHLTQAAIQALIDASVPTVPSELSDLDDVDTTGVADTYILQYNSGDSEWQVIPFNLNRISDVDTSGKADNYILQYNATSGNWEAEELTTSSAFTDLTDTPGSIEASELVAGNGGGDALIFSGITTTQISTALSQLALLIPAVPPLITTRTLVLSSYFSAKDAATGTTRTYVTIDTTPRIQLSTMSDAYAFYDPQAGTLFGVVDGSSIGSIALDNTDNSGTNLDLTITQNEDYYLGQTGKEGFYDAILARIDVSNALSASAAAHTAKLSIDNTDDTSTLSFYVESTLTPTLGSNSLTVSGSDPNLNYVSGIEVLGNGCEINVSATANDVIGYFFNSSKVIRLSDGVIGTNDYSPTAPIVTSDFSITSKTVTVGNGDYDSSYEVPITIYTPNNNTASGTIAPPSGFMIVDSVSNESNRLAVGTGQYPSSGYTGSYTSSTSLLSNEALQVSNGKHIYPSTDYSTLYPNNGPDYSNITGYRYSVFSLGNITNASSVSFTINGATGFNSVIESNVRIYVKVEGATDWLDANAAYSSGVPSSNGDAALDFGASSATSKRVTFGATTRTGTVYVRIGLNTNSTKTFTSIS